MNKVRDLQKLIQSEQAAGIQYGPASWHWSYRRSPYIYIGSLDSRLSEGDLLVAFSQFGEIVDIKLSRDKNSGDSRGFAWIAYEDPRSKVLAIEEMCGTELLGRTIFVDHASKHQNGQNVTKISTLSTTLAMNGTAPQQNSTGGLSGLALLGGGGRTNTVSTTNNNNNNNNDDGNNDTLQSQNKKKKQKNIPKVLTGNLLNDIDDSQFDDDDDIDQRRQLVWDYEAFYNDSDDETLCQVIYNRLQSGEKLVRDVSNNTILTLEEYEFNQELYKKQQSYGGASQNGAILSLDDLSQVHNAGEIDVFNSTAVAVDSTQMVVQSNAQPTTTPQSFDDVWKTGSGTNRNDNDGDNGGREKNEMNPVEFVKEMGFTLGSFAKGLSKGKDAVAFDVLEKLRITRLKRNNPKYQEDDEGGDARQEEQDDYDDYDDYNDSNYHDDYQPQKESNQRNNSQLERDRRYERYDNHHGAKNRSDGYNDDDRYESRHDQRDQRDRTDVKVSRYDARSDRPSTDRRDYHDRRDDEGYRNRRDDEDHRSRRDNHDSKDSRRDYSSSKNSRDYDR